MSNWHTRYPQKFIIDNTLHCLMGFVVGVTAGRGPYTLIAITMGAFIIGREQTQGGADHFWGYDPHADWFFYLLGFYLGTMVPR